MWMYKGTEDRLNKTTYDSVYLQITIFEFCVFGRVPFKTFAAILPRAQPCKLGSTVTEMTSFKYELLPNACQLVPLEHLQSLFTLGTFNSAGQQNSSFPCTNFIIRIPMY